MKEGFNSYLQFIGDFKNESSYASSKLWLRSSVFVLTLNHLGHQSAPEGTIYGHRPKCKYEYSLTEPLSFFLQCQHIENNFKKSFSWVIFKCFPLLRI